MWNRQKKEGTLANVPSLGVSTAGGVLWGLVGDVCGNDHEFRLAVVLGKLHLRLAHRELAASGIALGPNLVQEIVVAEPLEYKRCSSAGLRLRHV